MINVNFNMNHIFTFCYFNQINEFTLKKLENDDGWIEHITTTFYKKFDF
jgi:hypothetical protein